jgi:predicted GNAT superfamily acetyltransferase
MFKFSKSTSDQELLEIIELQKNNLPLNLSKEEIDNQGFVTVVHSLQTLKKMNAIEQHVIIKSDDKVVGYLLAMTKKSQHDIDILKPMFETFKKVTYKNKIVDAYNYLVVGQVCIAKKFRGKGLLDTCYAAYKKFYEKKYDFAITEIATNNKRSINAHNRIGFKEIYRYTDTNNAVWSIVIWDW